METAVAQEDVEEEIKTTTASEIAQAGAEAVFAQATYSETRTEDVGYAPMAPPAVDVPEATIIERIELTEDSSGSVAEEEEVEEEVVPADISIAERLQPTEVIESRRKCPCQSHNCPKFPRS